MKVLITDAISDVGIKPLLEHAEVDVKLKLKPEELIAIIGDYEALLVRSQTQVTAEVIKAGKKLQVIARAGVGIDNIDVDAATQQGIMVVNAPTGNIISAAEHTIALMFSLARHVPQANTSLKSGQWKRKHFLGIEISDKTLGIIGLGNVGSEVAKRARGLDMKLIAYDPFISTDHAGNLHVELVPLEQLLKEADFITLHLPLTATTKGIIGAKELAMVKPTARIINCGRGGLVDEAALAKAVKEKRLAGAAVDVFAQEPTTESVLFDDDNIIVTPHLGASTAEAQDLVARDAAEQIVAVLKGMPGRYAVNAPLVSPETLTVLAPYVELAATIGRIVSQLVSGQLNSIQINYEGDISNFETNIIKASVLSGLLEGISEERVNLINANVVATNRGLAVVEEKEAMCENYSSLLTVSAATSTGVTSLAGTVMSGESHIVRVAEYWLDIMPTKGYFLFAEHLDRPGLISAVSKVTGDSDVNISTMHVARHEKRGGAIMVLALDETLSQEQLEQVLSIPDVYSAKLVRL